ncbi:MAG TPA: hypothetical protein VF062_23065 [Candidatus Limnocylindrales bacterium]
MVDDGLGIGAIALAVLRHVLRHRPAYLWFATPVCPKARAHALAALADDVISVVTPPGMVMAGSFYARLTPVSDGEVPALLSTRRQNVSHTMPHRSVTLQTVHASDRDTNRAVNPA